MHSEDSIPKYIYTLVLKPKAIRKTAFLSHYFLGIKTKCLDLKAVGWTFLLKKDFLHTDDFNNPS